MLDLDLTMVSLNLLCKLILFQNAETRKGSNGVGLVEVIVPIGIRCIEITWLKIASNLVGNADKRQDFCY